MREADGTPPEPVPAAPPPAPPPLTLELDIAPDQLARLLRNPALAAMRSGPARGTAFRLTWFDTADHQLAAKGLALEIAPARRGLRQSLRRVLPELGAAWIAGAPGPVLDEAVLPGPTPDAVAAGLAQGTPLVALAAGEGRQRTLPISIEGSPARLSLLEGKLRTVAAEQPFARISITAPPALVFSVAARLCEEAPLLPAWPLPEVARALALGGRPRAPHLGAPQLAAGMMVDEGFAHTVLHLTATMLWLLPGVLRNEGPEAVHQLRVALRRLRSAFAVWRPVIDGDGLRGLDSGLKDFARRLGPVRDRDVFLGGTFADLGSALGEHGADRAAPLQALGAALAAQRQAAHAALTEWCTTPAFRQLVVGLLGCTASRPWRDATDQAVLDAMLEGFAAGVLHRRSRKLLKQPEDLADVPVTVLHAMRLSGKRLRYAAEFFAPLFPSRRTKRYLRRLAALQEALGIVNDGAVAGQLVRSRPAVRGPAALARAWAEGAVDGFAAARAAAARGEAAAAWAKFRDAAPFWTD
jgi:CHAD domain-containing protein